MLSSPGSTPRGRGERWGPCRAPAHLVCTDVDPGGAPVLLDHLGQDALEQGQGVRDVGVEAVGEALDLPQVLVLLVLEDELRGGAIGGCPGEPLGSGMGSRTGTLYLHMAKGLHQGNHLQLVLLRQLLDPLDVLLAGRAGTGSAGDARAEGAAWGQFPFLPLLWHPAHVAPVAPHMCALY